MLRRAFLMRAAKLASPEELAAAKAALESAKKKAEDVAAAKRKAIEGGFEYPQAGRVVQDLPDVCLPRFYRTRIYRSEPSEIAR